MKRAVLLAAPLVVLSCRPPRWSGGMPVGPAPETVAPTSTEAQSLTVTWDLQVIYPDNEQKTFVVGDAADVPLRSARWRCRHSAVTHPEHSHLEALMLVCVDTSGAQFDVHETCPTSAVYINSIPVVLHEGANPDAAHVIILGCKNF